MAEPTRRMVLDREDPVVREELARERTSLVTVAAAGYGADPKLQKAFEKLGIETVPLNEALDALTAATLAGKRIVSRPAILDGLVRLAVRDGAEAFSADNQPMVSLLEALVAERAPAGEVPNVPELAEELRQAFVQAGRQEVIAGGWQIVEPIATRSLNLSDDERYAPRCMDEEPIVVNGKEAAQISVEFLTDRSVQQMAHWADPTSWPDCSIYFTAMEPLSPPQAWPGPPNGWDATFTEVVDYPGKVLRTPLEFFYREDFAHGMVSSEYRLVQETEDIEVDQGFVEATADGPPNRPTRVRSLKVIRFRDPDLQDTASIACDTFWIELAMTMALDCSQGSY